MRKYVGLALLSTVLVLVITLTMPALFPASLTVEAATLPQVQATPTPDLPIDVALYVLEVTQQSTTMGQAIGDMSDLLGAPAIGDTNWMVDLAVAFVTIRQAHESIMALDVPPEMASVHREVLSMSMACNNATLAISAGIDNMDVDELNRGSDLLVSCGANAQTASAAMSAALATYNNTPAKATATPTLKATPKPATKSPTANKNANLRSGPGTTFAVVGSVKAGQPLTLVGRNADNSWYKLKTGQWIAAFLVTGAPTTLPVVK